MIIIEKSIEELQEYENNPRNNDGAVEAVAASIKEFGFKVPIVIDKNNVIVAGHTRLKAARKLGLETVPCIVADDLTPEQIKAFRVADNKTAELAEWDFTKLSEELSELADINFDMEQFGFDELEQEQAEIIEDEAPEVDEENEPTTKLGDIWQLGRHRLMCGDSTDAATVSKLMNGEKADLVFTDPPYGMKKEADGVANDNLNYDDLLEFNKQWIPLTFEALKENGSWYCWGIDEPLMDIYSEILRPMIKAEKIVFRNFIKWKKSDFVQNMLAPSGRSYSPQGESCLFVMSGGQAMDGFCVNQDDYNPAMDKVRLYMVGEAERLEITPAKIKKICGVGMYSHWFSKSQYSIPTKEQYKKLQEYYKSDDGFKKKYDELKKEYDELKKEYDELKKEYDELKNNFYQGRAFFDNTHEKMGDIWEFERTSQQERELCGGHATPKPIALCSRAIKSSSREGETVLDVFGGSGSTLIACEQLNRSARLMELEPKWCDVIIKRWETLTGGKAELIM